MNAFKLSADIWNLCVNINDQYRKDNDGKWIGQSELQKATKKCVPLSAKVIHHTVHKYLHARDAILKARKSGRIDEKFPYKTKRYFLLGWDYQAIKVNGYYILLSRESTNRKRNKPLKCYVKNIPDNIVEIEIVYRDKPYIVIKYKEKDIENDLINKNNHASIDLGEIHTVTSIDNEGHVLIITGRKMREIKHLRNKQQSKIYKRLSRCTKGSKQYYKYRRALKNLKYKTERKINDTVHKITKLYLDFCLRNQISVVYYGDLDSATRGTKKKKKSSRFVRQKLSQWNHGQVMLQLHNKLSRHKIRLVKVSEAYTSQTCPCCGHRYHPKGRDYICSECGYRQHRDIVGAINILNFNDGYTIVNYKSKLYLQIA